MNKKSGKFNLHQYLDILLLPINFYHSSVLLSSASNNPFIPILQNILNTSGRFVGLFIFGIFLNTILIINYGVTPVSGLWGPVDRETGIIFGWKQITKEISTLKEKNNIRNVLFSDYRVGSLYASILETSI